MIPTSKGKMVLPVCFARLSDVGLKKRSHRIANERMQGFIWWVFTERENSELGRHWFVCIYYRSTFNERQAESKQEKKLEQKISFSLNNCSFVLHTN